jgi:hypothetical protein
VDFGSRRLHSRDARNVGPPSTANATCGEECDQQYSSDVDDCHSNFGDDPSDAEDLANCIQGARDDDGSCVDDCARPMVLSSFVSAGRCGAVSDLLHDVASRRALRIAQCSRRGSSR